MVTALLDGSSFWCMAPGYLGLYDHPRKFNTAAKSCSMSGAHSCERVALAGLNHRMNEKPTGAEHLHTTRSHH